MRRRNVPISVAAGLLTPLLLFGLLKSAGVIFQPDPVFVLAALVAGFLLAFGITLWAPVDPILYGIVLAPSPAGCFWIVAGPTGRSGNFFGLAVIALLFLGVIIGGTAGVCGWLARRWPLPSWSPIVPITGACLVSVIFGQVEARRQVYRKTPDIIRLHQQIRTAEQTYAAIPPPVQNPWNASVQAMFLVQTSGAGSRPYLHCTCSAGKKRPSAFVSFRRSLFAALADFRADQCGPTSSNAV